MDKSDATSPKEPWWVQTLTTGGRPTVALIVMIMCGPGEHHLGVLAGWNNYLAWGMAAVLAAYAGIAAVIATRRPSWSATTGAILSLAAAMTAQPVSHLFVTGWLSATPRSPLWLVVSVSCIPPLVFGHLLHLAASHPHQGDTPSETPAQTHATTSETPTETTETTPVSPRDEEPTRTSELLSTREVAIRMGVSPSTVSTWVSRGKLTPASRDERGNLFDPTHLAS